MYRKIVSNGRYMSDPSGGPLTFTIELGDGGNRAKRVQIMVLIRQFSGNNVRMHMELRHGPDGRMSAPHSDLIGTSGSPSAPSADLLMVGESDGNKMLGEYLELAFTLSDSATTAEQWIVADIYEVRNAF